MDRDLLQWIEIDSDALRHNLQLFRDLVPRETRIQLVVKANAYGHGLEEVVGLAPRLPIDVIGVHALGEAIRVRAAGWIGPVYVLGYVPEARLSEAAAHDLELTVFGREMLAAVQDAGRQAGDPIRVHLKVETGTHRQGMGEEELRACLSMLDGQKGATLAGASTHFANIEDTTDGGYARAQLAEFGRLTDPIRARHPGLVRHTACSAAALTLPETAFDLVRIGIAAYGYWPSRETRVSFRERGATGHLRPALSWKARIGQVREIPTGAFVGYGCTERVVRPTRMAVLPIGYSDGFDRGLSRIGHVLVHGRRARVLGRVCMNIVLVDVTDIDSVAVEDEVVLLGESGSESISADDIAASTQTLSYEVLARLSPAIPRRVRTTDAR